MHVIARTAMPAARMPLHAGADPDGRGARRGQPLAERLDALDGQSRDLGDAGRRIRLDALAEGVPAERVRLDELAVLGAPGDHDVQQSERQRRIGARPRRQMLVGRSALRVRTGSITTTCGRPCARAASTNFQM